MPSAQGEGPSDACCRARRVSPARDLQVPGAEHPGEHGQGDRPGEHEGPPEQLKPAH